MKNIYLIFALSALGLFPGHPSLAGTLGYCRPLGSIAPKVEDCSDNSIFLAQAKECESALDKEVASTSSSLKTLLLAQSAGSGQAGKLGQTSQDYGVSGAQLDSLILLAGTAAQDVGGYEKNLVLPEDIENPDIAGSDAQSYADHASCYGDTMKGLKATEAKMNQIKAQLTSARAATVSLGKSSTQGQGAQSGLQNAPTTPGATPSPSAAPPVGTYDPSFSDISGTKKTNP